MPALLAYLVALTILIGGGYGGLHYLSEHNGPELTKSQQAKLAARKKFEREAATRLADTAEPAEETAPVAATPPASVASVVAAEPPVVPAPAPAVRQIAIDAASKPRPNTAPVAIADNAKVEPSIAPSSAARSADLPVAVAATDPVASEADLTPLPASRPAAAPAEPTPARRAEDAMAALTAPDTAPAAVTANNAERTAVPAVAKPTRKARKAAPARARPVMMTLQTIEYPDGRIAQRLVPLQQQRRAAATTRMSRVEWFGGAFD